MRKISKVFLSCTAAAALTAGIATTALAADYQNLTASYADNGDVGKVTITCSSQDSMKTVLVLKPGKDLTNFESSDILQIDQKDTITEVTVPKMTKGETAVTYNVYMGGTSGTVYAGSFTIAAEGGNTEVSTVLLGDANLSNKVDGLDALETAKHAAKMLVLAGDALQAADANDSGKVDGMDALEIAKFAARQTSNVDGKKTISDKKNMVSVN